MNGRINVWRLLRGLAVATAMMLAAPAFAACSVANTAPDLGSQSPQALKANGVPYFNADGGFTCDSSSLVSLLANNYLRATVAAGTAMTLAGPSGSTVSYILAGMPDGTVPLTAGTPADYVGGNGTTILALNLGAPVNARIYIKPSNIAALVPPGDYTGFFNVKWDWRFCSLIYIAGNCTGTLTQGSATAKVTIKLTVAAKPMGVQISYVTTWDPISGTNAPKTLPGSKQRASLTLTNNDIIPLDLNTLAIVLPTVAKTAVALDGDGTFNPTVVRSAQGSPASGLTLSYTNPADQGDDVDFSNNNGTSWTYVPVAGDAATQGAVTGVRFRPKGSMAASSSFTMSIPYSVK